MKKIAIILIAVIILALIGSIFVSGIKSSDISLFGEIWKADSMSKDGNVAAVCNGEELLMSRIESERKIAETMQTDAHETDFEIAQRLVINELMEIEAEKLGLGASKDEINSMVSNAKIAYELPDGKEYIDEFCAGAGISVEQYFKEVENNAESAILRQKLRDYYGMQYCELKGLTFTKVNPPIEMEEHIDSQLYLLLEKYDGIYTIYLDKNA